MVRKPDQAICLVLSSFWGGLLLACLALTWTSRHGARMGIPDALPYSIWAVLAGLGCFSLGAFRWFGGFLCGGLFFVVAGLMPLLVRWAGPIFAGTWALVLAILAIRLRGLRS